MDRHPTVRTEALIRLCLLALSALLIQAAHASPISVAVETTDCEGETGFASFESTRLAKIQDATCRDPDDRDKKLQQVLLHSDHPSTKYEVLTVTNAESKSIMKQIKGITEAELRNLERPDVVVEHNQTLQSPPSRATSTRSTVTTQQTGETVPPEIEISDPPVTRMRTLTNVITDPSLSQRQIVGSVKSPHDIVSLTVNGQSFPVSQHGVFSAPVTLAGERTPVAVVAVDNQGGSSTVEFHLVRASPTPTNTRTSDEFGAYHALIIANAEYDHLDNLVTPLNDGEEVAKILSQNFGFKVTKLFNASRYDMMSALNGMRRTLTEQDNLLIYFAGHGAFDKANNRGHWLPVNAEHDSTANWVSTIDVTDIVNAMSARHILVVADSCYSGALTRSEHTELDPGMSDDLRSRWLRAVAETRSRHLLTSGGIKPIVDDGGNGHSVFANALLEVLRSSTGIVESSTVYQRIRPLVADRARELQLDQTPRYAKLKRTGHEFGEFLLVSRLP